jgi:Spy/CpxP family protein refolding chaperone
MWRSGKRFLIVASVGLNLAFVGVWLSYAIPAGLGDEGMSSPPVKMGRIWCPLHEELNVSDEQWAKIEPRLMMFRQSADSICRHVGRLRLEMVDLIAAPTPDLEAIAAKQDEIQAGQRKMQELVIGHLLAEKEHLAPEQEVRLFMMIRKQSGCDRKGPLMMPGRPYGGVGQMFRNEQPSQ